MFYFEKSSCWQTAPSSFLSSDNSCFRSSDVRGLLSPDCVWQVEEGVEPCVFWPHKGQPISFDQFTVTQRSQSHVCLSNEDELVVHTYSLESAQVIPSSTLLGRLDPPWPLMSSAHACSSDSRCVSWSAQDDYVLEVTHYSTLCWPNPDSPISQTFELINLVKEENSHKDGPVVVHDE